MYKKLIITLILLNGSFTVSFSQIETDTKDWKDKYIKRFKLGNIENNNDSLKGVYEKIQPNIKILVEIDSIFHDKFLSSNYEFELKDKIYSSLIPKDKKQYEEIYKLIKFFQNKNNLQHHYKYFLSNLAKGHYSNSVINFEKQSNKPCPNLYMRVKTASGR